MNYLALVLCVAACSVSPDREVREQSPVPAVAPKESLPDGWRRVELAKLPASIAIPVGAAIRETPSECRDSDGLVYATSDVEVTLDESAQLSLSTCPTMGFRLTTLAAAKAEYASSNRPLHVAASDEKATGEWALTLEGGFVVGWSPRARVMCRTQGTRDPALAQRICTSILPSRTPFEPAADPVLSFPNEHEPAAREVLASLQQATSRGDAARFLALVDPAGLVVRGARMDRAALEAELARTSLHALLQVSQCGPAVYAREPGSACIWATHRNAGSIVAMPALSTTSEWPTLRLAATASGWRLVELSFLKR